MAVTQFVDDYAFLSNIFPASFVWQGIIWKSVDYAFLAAKTLNMDSRRELAAMPNYASAKHYSMYLEPLRPDWASDKVKDTIMTELIKAKFTQNLELKAKLIATNDLNLIAGNAWGDSYWGVCFGKGENVLGQLLMQLRAELMEPECVETTPEN